MPEEDEEDDSELAAAELKVLTPFARNLWEKKGLCPGGATTEPLLLVAIPERTRGTETPEEAVLLLLGLLLLLAICD